MSVIKDKFKSIISLPLVQNTMKLSASSIILMLLPIVVTPILSRLYSPSDYGDWGLFTSALYIVTPLLFGSYEYAIVKARNYSDVANLVGLCLLFSSGIIFLTAITFIIGKCLGISFFEKFPSLSLFVYFLVICAIHTVCNHIANREERYGAMSISNIINGFSQAGFRVLFGVLPLLSLGLIWGTIIAQLLSTLYIYWCIRNIFLNKYFKDISLKGVKQVAKDNIKFPKYDSPARFVEFAMASLPIIVLSMFWGKDDIGCFSMITQLVLLPISTVGSAVGQVYYREISSQVDDMVQIRSTTIKVAKIMMSLSLLPVIFLSLGGDHFVVWFLGDQWKSSGMMALCLAIFSVPTIISEPLLPMFRALNYQDERFRLNLLNVLLSIGALFVVPHFTDNIFVAIISYASFYALVRFIFIFRIAHRTNIAVLRVSRIYNILCLLAYSLLFIRISMSL